MTQSLHRFFLSTERDVHLDASENIIQNDSPDNQDSFAQPTGSIFHSRLNVRMPLFHVAGARPIMFTHKPKKAHPTAFSKKVQAVIDERQQWKTSMFLTQIHNRQLLTHPQV